MVFSLMLRFYFPKVSVLMGCPFFISWLERAGFVVVFFFLFPCSHCHSHIIGFFSSKSGYMGLKESLENSPPCVFFHVPKSLFCLPSSLHLSVASCVSYMYVWCFKVLFYMTNREMMFTLCSHGQNSYTFNCKMRKLRSWIGPTASSGVTELDPCSLSSMLSALTIVKVKCRRLPWSVMLETVLWEPRTLHPLPPSHMFYLRSFRIFAQSSYLVTLSSPLVGPESPSMSSLEAAMWI